MIDVALVHNNHELHITASRVETTRVEKTEYEVREVPRGYHRSAISILGKMGWGRYEKIFLSQGYSSYKKGDV